MSSPSPPDPQKVVEHSYQTSEEGDHVLLTHSHACQCSEKCALDSKAETTHIHCLSHHHNVLNLTHVPPSSTSHIHPVSQSVHVHVHASPKTGHTSKVNPPTCNCHTENTENTAETTIRQNRKIEADDRIEVSPLPPALPPRPPPRPRNELTSRPRSRECECN